jgi:hypothetical protein
MAAAIARIFRDFISLKLLEFRRQGDLFAFF